MKWHFSSNKENITIYTPPKVNSPTLQSHPQLNLSNLKKNKDSDVVVANIIKGAIGQCVGNA
jgi:hypothetical protein